MPFKMSTIKSDFTFEYAGDKFLSPHDLPRQYSTLPIGEPLIRIVNMGKYYCDVEDLSELNRIRSCWELSPYEFLEFLELCHFDKTGSECAKNVFVEIFDQQGANCDYLMMQFKNDLVFPSIFRRLEVVYQYYSGSIDGEKSSSSSRSSSSSWSVPRGGSARLRGWSRWLHGHT